MHFIESKGPAGKDLCTRDFLALLSVEKKIRTYACQWRIGYTNYGASTPLKKAIGKNGLELYLFTGRNVYPVLRKAKQRKVYIIRFNFCKTFKCAPIFKIN